MQGSHRVRRARRRNVPAATVDPGTKTKVVGYLRVSTEGQFADGFGLDVQERAVRAFAESQGYELVDIVTDCISGSVAPQERPGFARVLDMAAEGAFTALLLYRFDRLARNVLFAVQSVHLLRDRYSVVVRSVTEPIDTATPMGEMIFTVLASMAAQERQLITERTFGGRKEKALKGGFAGGRAPYGYRKTANGSLEVDHEQAAVVRRIYAARQQKRTLQAIADELNAENIPSPEGKKWHPPRVAYVLDNPRYRGAIEYLFQFGGTETHVLREGVHEAIL